MAQTIQRSFTGGEIAPALRSRADIIKYITGLALCKDFIVRPQGGVYSRPGTRLCGSLGNMNLKGRLIPFQFSTKQAYILVFEHLKMRVIKNAGFVLVGGGPTIFELATPYTVDQIPLLQFTQSADVMTITHPAHSPRDLSRTGDAAWTLTVINFSPTLPAPEWASSTVRNITGATNDDPCVIDTSPVAHGFLSDQFVSIAAVGGMTELNGNSYRIQVVSPTSFELVDIDSTSFGAYTSGGTATRSFVSTVGDGFGDYKKTYHYVVTAANDDDESLPSVVASIYTPSLSVTGGVLLDWDPVPDATYYRIYKDPSDGTGVYGWIGDSKTSQFTDFNIAPITSDAPPEDRDPFAGGFNKPSTVTYYQQRKVFGNTALEPQTIFTTQVGNYKSMRTSKPARDDDAVTFTINSRQVNEIRHLIELESLVVLTSGGEYRVTEGQDQVLTPSTVGVRKQSNNGSSWVSPAIVDDTIIYVQEKSSRVRDINYEFVDDKYKGNDLSIMAEHLFEGKTILEMGFAAEPYGVVWLIRSDGVLLGLTYQRQHQVWAWHQHHTDGEFESVAVISEDGRDAPYFIVKRVVNGQVVRYVERMAQRTAETPYNVWCVDSGLRYIGSPVTTLSGMEHLEGKAVAIVADGYVVADKVVSGGQVVLPRAASIVTIGLAYTPTIELLDIDVPSMSDTLKGKEISVSHVIVEVEKSRGLWVGPDADHMSEVKPRMESDGYDPIQLRTGKEEVTIEPGWRKGGGIRIEQRAPMPLAILSVIPEVDVS